MIFDKAMQLDLVEENIDLSYVIQCIVDEMGRLRSRLVECQQTLIPNGLHIVGGIKGKVRFLIFLAHSAKTGSKVT